MDNLAAKRSSMISHEMIQANGGEVRLVDILDGDSTLIQHAREGQA